MEIVLVEDEKPAARYLARRLEALGYPVTKQLHSVAEAVAWFTTNSHPDLIFLDIQLSDGLSFEIFDQVQITSAIIFTTAYDEYALKAFKLNSIDYLLKPIDPEELSFALAKFKQNSIANSISIASLKQLLQVNESSKTYKERFVVKIGQQIKIISVADVLCFFSENKATYLKTLENRDYLLDGSLETIENELDNKNFFRINRKFIIQRAAIADIHLFSNSRLKVSLKNFISEHLIVSREKVSEFKQWIN
ncbi:LytTR family DNA-binding domain-containing protein [Flavobacterium agricola]|uniref:LytTR family DNA-binding domain-containing protein n=1 Tax=Flavobacterium agricola TaxID=2870839 RepID=A0ABY6LWL2_9FLAO|nr:LytTR family DNA-binding domain-containing protein [Flavobacterium agricola]UYW00347.1 LytTR family DNA-binding domain-containing protein [Flavobacterium agricola]